MRISDWSSDVCSSDLTGDRPLCWASIRTRSWKRYSDWIPGSRRRSAMQVSSKRRLDAMMLDGLDGEVGHVGESYLRRFRRRLRLGRAVPDLHPRGRPWGSVRSEEHTSELQSLMRISYAVFCLKKK